ncbi:DNA polymerase III subunit gamma/tau, partial [bacterium]
MAYLSLYRKYRSQTFEDLIGQEHVVRTLQNAIRSGRIAQAYLFTGPRGTGKTSSARLLAKCLNCQSFDGPTPTPCNHCEMCVSITGGNALDVLEMDAASESGVDEVRQNIIDSAGIGPMIARYKVYIIDEVHDLSLKAFDALLKTIEEPPAHLVFILATTEAQRVPPTIRSRCQKFEFHRATMKNLTDRLGFVAEGEGVHVDPPALTAIARMADGGFRDALTLLEQAVLVGDGHVTLESVYDQLGLVSEEATDALLDAMRRADIPALMEGLEEIARQGRDPRAIVESMLHRLADLT